MAWEIHMKVLVNKSTDRTLTHVRGTILWWGEACAGWLVYTNLF